MLEWIYRFVANPEAPPGALKPRGHPSDTPASVLAPESALGSVPTVALSSAQVRCILYKNLNAVALTVTEGVENHVPTVVLVGRF